MRNRSTLQQAALSWSEVVIKALQRLKPNDANSPLCNLLLAWIMFGAMLLLAFMAPWAVNRVLN